MAGNYFIKKLIDWYNLEIAAGVRRHRKDIRLFERGSDVRKILGEA